MQELYIVSFTLHHTAFGVQERVKNSTSFQPNILYLLYKINCLRGGLSPMKQGQARGESLIFIIIDNYQYLTRNLAPFGPCLSFSPKPRISAAYPP